MKRAAAVALLIVAIATVLLGQAPTVPYLRRPRSGVVAVPSTLAFVNAAQGGAFNNSAANVATAALNVTTGNALVVFCTAQNSGTDLTGTATVSDTVGNTFTRVAGASVWNATNGHQIIAFYVLNATGNAADVITCNLNITNWVSAHALQFSGVATASALDSASAVASSSTTTGSSYTSPSFSTVQASEVTACGVKLFIGSQPETFTAGTGYTIPTNGTDTNGISAAEYQIFSSIQSSVTASISWTPNNNDAPAMGCLSLKSN